MASKTTSIPRFLLPRHGPLWRTAARTTTTTRAASTKPTAAKAARAAPPTKQQPPPPARASAGGTQGGEKRPEPAAPRQKPSPPWRTSPSPPSPPPPPQAADPSKPIVLEKPERFNPPSHGARLPRSMPKHYGGPATADEVKAQRERSYPGMPPPENTWSHWFIHSRGIHLFITLGTLSGLAAYSFAQSFRADSPFADLIPPISELPRHPLQYLGVCVDVVRLHEEHLSARTAEKRRRKADELAKRNEYRKAHGLEPAAGLWGARSVERPSQPPPPPSPSQGEGHDPQSPVAPGEPIAAAAAPAAETESDGKRKKFLGIF